MRRLATGRLVVVQDLRVHGIRCTSDGADKADGNGHADMVRNLIAHDITARSVIREEGAKC